jgi:hypothetical protein
MLGKELNNMNTRPVINSPFPEKCSKFPDIPCSLYGKGTWYEPLKCSEKPCSSVIVAKENGISLKVTGGSKRPYADTITHYKATLLVEKSEAEVLEYLIKYFRIGPEWYANKLEQFKPLPDGTGYAFTIRDPYKD